MRSRWMTVVLMVLMLLSTLALTGCYTMQGVGKDITAMGEDGEKLFHGTRRPTRYR